MIVHNCLLTIACFSSIVTSVQPGGSSRGRGHGTSTQSRGKNPTPAKPANAVETIDPGTVTPVPNSYVAVGLTSNQACGNVLKLFKDLNRSLFPEPVAGAPDPMDIVHSTHGNYCDNRAICDATYKCTFHSGWRGCPRFMLHQFLEGRVFKMRCKAQKHPFIKGGTAGNANAKVGCWEKDEVEEMEKNRVAAKEMIRINTAKKEKLRQERASTSRDTGEVDDRPVGAPPGAMRADTIDGVRVTGSMCVDLPGTSVDVPSWAGQIFDLTPFLLLDPPGPVDQGGKP